MIYVVQFVVSCITTAIIYWWGFRAGKKATK